MKVVTSKPYSMVPRDKNDESEKWLVDAKILANLKYRICSAAFKDPTMEPLGSIHVEFYRGWRRTMKILSAER